jgi:hypothetical protein
MRDQWTPPHKFSTIRLMARFIEDYDKAEDKVDFLFGT